MKKIKPFTLVTLTIYLVLLTSFAFAEDRDGRYVLAIPESTVGGYFRREANAKAPVVVLDTVLGIIWRCPDLKDEKPVWIKTDLGKNEDKVSSGRRYTIKIQDYPSAGQKIPAIVLDEKEGKVWVCYNIADEYASWVQKDLIEEIRIEGRKYR